MLAVSYMPYYPDRQVNITVGGFTIWNWRRHNTQMVSEQAVRAYLDRYFGLFRLPNGDPELRIAVISQVSLPAVPPVNQVPNREIGRFALATMACHLFELPNNQNAGWMACSSDNFVAFCKEFDPANMPPAPTFEYGSYIRTRIMGSWEHMRFTTPQYMPDPRPSPCDEELLGGLAGLSADDSEAIMRVYRSLDWVSLAFANYEGFQLPARVVAMSTAFETLLDFPETGKSSYFAQTANQLLPPNRLPTRTQPWGPAARQITDNEVGWWCRTFYDLRSRIVHGEQLQREDFYHRPGVEHLRIALNIFAECIRGLLIRMGRMQEQQRRARFWFRRPWLDQLGLPDNVWYP